MVRINAREWLVIKQTVKTILESPRGLNLERDHALSLWVKAREIARLHKNHNSAKAGGALAKCREPAFLGPGRYVGARQ